MAVGVAVAVPVGAHRDLADPRPAPGVVALAGRRADPAAGAAVRGIRQQADAHAAADRLAGRRARVGDADPGGAALAGGAAVEAGAAVVDVVQDDGLAAVDLVTVAVPEAAGAHREGARPGDAGRGARVAGHAAGPATAAVVDVVRDAHADAVAERLAGGAGVGARARDAALARRTRPAAGAAVGVVRPGVGLAAVREAPVTVAEVLVADGAAGGAVAESRRVGVAVEAGPAAGAAVRDVVQRRADPVAGAHAGLAVRDRGAGSADAGLAGGAAEAAAPAVQGVVLGVDLAAVGLRVVAVAEARVADRVAGAVAAGRHAVGAGRADAVAGAAVGDRRAVVQLRLAAVRRVPVAVAGVGVAQAHRADGVDAHRAGVLVVAGAAAATAVVGRALQVDALVAAQGPASRAGAGARAADADLAAGADAVADAAVVTVRLRVAADAAARRLALGAARGALARAAHLLAGAPGARRAAVERVGHQVHLAAVAVVAVEVREARRTRAHPAHPRRARRRGVGGVRADAVAGAAVHEVALDDAAVDAAEHLTNRAGRASVRGADVHHRGDVDARVDHGGRAAVAGAVPGAVDVADLSTEHVVGARAGAGRLDAGGAGTRASVDRSRRAHAFARPAEAVRATRSFTRQGSRAQADLGLSALADPGRAGVDQGALAVQEAGTVVPAGLDAHAPVLAHATARDGGVADPASRVGRRAHVGHDGDVGVGVVVGVAADASHAGACEGGQHEAHEKSGIAHRALLFSASTSVADALETGLLPNTHPEFTSFSTFALSFTFCFLFNLSFVKNPEPTRTNASRSIPEVQIPYVKPRKQPRRERGFVTQPN